LETQEYPVYIPFRSEKVLFSEFGIGMSRNQFKIMKTESEYGMSQKPGIFRGIPE